MFDVGGLGFEFCMFVAGWRHALRSEWPFMINIMYIAILVIGRHRCCCCGLSCCYPTSMASDLKRGIGATPGLWGPRRVALSRHFYARACELHDITKKQYEKMISIWRFEFMVEMVETAPHPRDDASHPHPRPSPA